MFLLLLYLPPLLLRSQSPSTPFDELAGYTLSLKLVVAHRTGEHSTCRTVSARPHPRCEPSCHLPSSNFLGGGASATFNDRLLWLNRIRCPCSHPLTLQFDCRRSLHPNVPRPNTSAFRSRPWVSLPHIPYCAPLRLFRCYCTHHMRLWRRAMVFDHSLLPDMFRSAKRVVPPA